jgi:hypothetical protein
LLWTLTSALEQRIGVDDENACAVGSGQHSLTAGKDRGVREAGSRLSTDRYADMNWGNEPQFGVLPPVVTS